MKEAVLEISDLSVILGGRTVLDGVSFDVASGETFGLIGPNGAGKTTLINCLSGYCRPTGGELRFEGVPINGIKPDRITAAGIGRTFQSPELSPSLTVREAVLTGGNPRTRAGLFALSIRLPRVFRETRRERERAMEVLHEMDLAAQVDDFMDTIPTYARRRVEVARALLGSPTVLLLDEPAVGLRKEELEDFAGLLGKLKRRYGLSILLVEHQVSLVMQLCQRVAVLAGGRKVAEGTPEEVRADPAAIGSYLGRPAC